jgi:hypothetical protein
MSNPRPPATSGRLRPILEVVDRAKASFHATLEDVAAKGEFTKEAYHRYLSMQFHLTRQVQRHFMIAASHHSLMERKKLRDFLVTFANEEEPHYLIAESDLRKMGLEPLPCPLDVELWQNYFLPRAHTHPLHRLGATCVLENLGAGAGRTGRQLLSSASFLNGENTRFLDIHFHEVLPHGEQIVAALESIALTDREIQDARKGAMVGTILYFRLVDWVFRRDSVQSLFDELELTTPLQ